MRIAVLGAAFSAGGVHPGCRYGPNAVHRQVFPKRIHRQRLRWAGEVRETSARLQRYPEGLGVVLDSVQRLQRRVQRLRSGAVLPVIIGGDHTCAMGTWSGIASIRQQPIGLLWLDAHLDSHTPESSESHRLHGMPLAVLLGEGDPRLTHLAGFSPVVDARYSAVLGVRSFETIEPLRLQRLGVRCYTVEEIQRRGLANVLREAWQRVSAAPGGFGVSLDLDVLEPAMAPGVSVPEPHGLHPKTLARLLHQQGRKHRLRGLEIVELNPRLDRRGKTRRLLPMLLDALLTSRQF